VDTADEAAVNQMAKAAVKAMGNIDILVAAAGPCTPLTASRARL